MTTTTATAAATTAPTMPMETVDERLTEWKFLQLKTIELFNGNNMTR
jgi:hypothetical protein